MRVLIMDNEFGNDHAHASAAIGRLVLKLEKRNVKVISSQTIVDAYAIVASNTRVDCVLVTKSDRNQGDECQRRAASPDAELPVIEKLHQRQPNVPVFLLADRGSIREIVSLQLAKKISEYVWISEDSVTLLVGRILFAIGKYQQATVPCLISALRDYHHPYQYSWVIPGHQGGVGFTKTPVGKAFYDFFGENLFRSDLNLARASLRSSLSHSGAIAESKTNIARIFGADVSFSGVVGSSGSNRSVMQFCVRDGQTAAIDRNCHKSITQGLILTAANPVYMVASRNRYGIIGPIGVAEIRKVVANDPVYGVITNCTLDGICYNSATLEQEMRNIPYVHLDEAWFAYARFNPLYQNLHGMRGDPKADAVSRQPSIFVTHSTHKMLNALSMASYIHVRSGRQRPVNVAKFKQAYMMHTTTSPSFPIFASNEIAARMMDGQTGQSLTQEVIDEAVDFRQTLAFLYREYANKKDWFFKPWNIEEYEGVPFEELPAGALATQQKYWMMKPGDRWHGFADLVDEDWAMLDPIKVSILTPGMDADGEFGNKGVPAVLVNAWLVHKGIVSTRITNFQLMFLFTMGITKGKWGMLLEGLYSFKLHYDDNAPIKTILPQVCQNTSKYNDMGLQDLGIEMFEFLKETDLPKLMHDAYGTLPMAQMTPHEGYQNHISKAELVKLEEAANRIVTTPILPVPRGIPMMISGESFGESTEMCPHIKYLLALKKWDQRFPGFEKETMGVEIDSDGNHQILCVVEN